MRGRIICSKWLQAPPMSCYGLFEHFTQNIWSQRVSFSNQLRVDKLHYSHYMMNFILPSEIHIETIFAYVQD